MRAVAMVSVSNVERSEFRHTCSMERHSEPLKFNMTWPYEDDATRRYRDRLQRFAWRWLAASYLLLIGGYLLTFVADEFFDIGLYGPIPLSTISMGVAISTNRWKQIVLGLLIALVQMPISFLIGISVSCSSGGGCL